MQLDRPFMCVTPTLDGDVLGVLATVDAGFTPSQLQRMIDASGEGIRKVLKRLSSQGIVSDERVGNATRYRLNRNHLAAAPIIALTEIRSMLIANLEALFDTWPAPPKYAALFGSSARGRMSMTSDIDILLVRSNNTDDEAWNTAASELSHQVHEWTGNDVRFLEFSEAELPGRASDEPVLRDILEQGVTLCGSRSWLLQATRTNRAARRGVPDANS